MLMVVKLKLAEIVKQKGHDKTSYRKLAKEMGVSHVPLWKMLNGESYNPSLAMLDKICKFLRCEPGDLLERKK